MQAGLVSDSEQIMDDAQIVYSKYFPSKQATQVLDPYHYRFYPTTGVYLGINQSDSGVYLLGGEFGDTPVFVDKTENVITLLKNQMGGSGNSKSDICDTSTIPTGFTIKTEGDTTHISTDGKCLEMPENRGVCDTLPEKDTNNQPIATGIHMLTHTAIANYEVSGFDIPGFDAIAKDMASQKACIINAPAGLTTHTVHLDVCYDMTKQLSAVPGIKPPVTLNMKASSNSTRVDNCFKTDAATITNIVTEEFWMNKGGAFEQIK